MNQSPSIQLFCFPHAGASAATYMRWRRLLPSWIEVHPVELPGRGQRLAEPLERTMDGVLAQVTRVVRRDPSLPFALFGHSLGAIVAFEYARKLQRERSGAPLLLFASGSHAPSYPDRGRPLVSDAELLAELMRLDGTPAPALHDAELMQLTLPVLRADFQVAASYRCEPGATVLAPVHVLRGLQDDIAHDSLTEWAKHTRAGFALDSFEGGHFFIHEKRDEVISVIERALAQRLRVSVSTYGHVVAPFGGANAAPRMVQGGPRAKAVEH